MTFWQVIVLERDKSQTYKHNFNCIIVHLAGFVHGACDYKGAIPVKLNVADFPSVTSQSVDTSEKKNRKRSSVSCSLFYTESMGVMHALCSISDDKRTQMDTHYA